MPTKAELEAQIAELKELGAQVAKLEAQQEQLSELRTIALAFTLGGQIVNATSNTHSTPQEFAAQKAALQSALNQTDALLIAAVRREAQNDAKEPEL